VFIFTRIIDALNEVALYSTKGDGATNQGTSNVVLAAFIERAHKQRRYCLHVRAVFENKRIKPKSNYVEAN